jgi:hypothetical protein
MKTDYFRLTQNENSRQEKMIQDVNYYLNLYNSTFKNLITPKTRRFSCNLKSLLGNKKFMIREIYNNHPGMTHLCYKKFILLCYRFDLKIHKHSSTTFDTLIANDQSGKIYITIYTDQIAFDWDPYGY